MYNYNCFTWVNLGTETGCPRLINSVTEVETNPRGSNFQSVL